MQEKSHTFSAIAVLISVMFSLIALIYHVLWEVVEGLNI